LLLIFPDDLVDFAVVFLVAFLGARSDLVDGILHIAHVILLLKVKAHVVLLVIGLRDATPTFPSRAG